MRDAFRLDPLSPIINANVGFDALRFGDEAEAEARFAAAIEIDPAFPVPYSGMARLHARAVPSRRRCAGSTGRSSAHRRGRSISHARGSILAQLGRIDAAVAAVEAACRNPTGNRFEADLVAGLRVVSGNRAALESIATDDGGSTGRPPSARRRSLALGNLPAALEAYAEDPPDPRGVDQ